jgi:thioredoxin-like negative regulator of GroEL
MEYQEITLLDEINETIEKHDALLMYFSAPHCNVCKILKPKVAEMISEEFPEIKLVYVDIDKAPALSGQFRIFSIPTILVYFGGKEFFRKSRNIGISDLALGIERPYSLLFE